MKAPFSWSVQTGGIWECNKGVLWFSPLLCHVLRLCLKEHTSIQTANRSNSRLIFSGVAATIPLHFDTNGFF